MNHRIVRLFLPTTDISIDKGADISLLRVLRQRQTESAFREVQQEVEQDLTESEEEKPYVERPVRLKRGAGRFDAAEVAATVEELECMLKYHPDEFTAVRDLALGRVSDIPPAIAKEFKEACWLDLDGKLIPILLAAFLASYRNTDEGEIIVDPFAPANGEEVQALHDLDETKKKFLRDLIKETHYRLNEDDDSPGLPERN